MAKVPELVIGEPLTDRNDGTEAATDVTVPPGLLELMVWFGQVPVMLTLEPATKARCGRASAAVGHGHNAGHVGRGA